MPRPEETARDVIDEQLNACGWVVQDIAQVNLGAGRGVAIREFQTASGPADYGLFVDRVMVGVVEAKKAGVTLTGVEEQSARYSVGLPSWVRVAGDPLPFAYETTGVETRFTSRLDPVPRSRGVFTFHRPETLAEWLAQARGEGVMRTRLRNIPALDVTGLRDCQVEAITNLERSFAQDRPRALVQMATGSGKTFTAISEIYRLLKYGGAKRALFLVDRSNLGKQALNEFAQYSVPGDGRKFTELYNVQRLETNRLDPVANVVITTIQRLYAMLSGKPEFEPVEEETSFFGAPFEPPREVRYNPAVPIETFDVVVTDECHRSIYNQWRGVLEYFDSYLVGLTATPGTATFGFFHSNLVMEYGHDRAVADGVNVDYQVFRIRTDVTERGATIPVEEWVDRRDRRTRKVRWEQLDDDLTYAPNQLDRDVVAPDQIRTVIRAFRDALPTMFPGRTEVPKTLIFAKDDAHADDITQIVREEFAQGNEFCQKITYRATGAKPEDLIASFRNSYNPRVAVTVDMVATGTDIKPLEVLLFMRSVKSRTFFEQMKGRGSRVIADTDLQAVTPDAASKTRFVLVDAVGVCEQMKTDEPPLERKRSVAFAKLLEQVAMGARDEDTLSSLAGRLGRLSTRLTPDEAKEVATLSGGLTTRDLANGLLRALDPDAQVAAAQTATGQTEPDEAAMRQAAEQLADEAARPFDSPQLRQVLAGAQRRDEQIIDTVTQDTLLAAEWDGQAEDQARRVAQSFRAFIAEHQDEIAAFDLLYSRPRGTGPSFRDLKRLAQEIAAPPLGLTSDTLWQAYAQLDHDRVRGASEKRVTTDLLALLRYALARDTNPQTATLQPYPATVMARYTDWLAKQERQSGQPFTPEQREWLQMIAEHIATSLAIGVDDFDLEPFTQRGGLGKAYTLFGPELTPLLEDLNARLVA